MESLLNFVHDPDNAVILYGIAAFMVLDGLFLLIIKPLLAKSMDALPENIAKTVSKEQKTTVGSVLKLTSLISMILGIALAAYVFLNVA